MSENNTLESSNFYGRNRRVTLEETTFSRLLPHFLNFCRYEQQFSQETVDKYHECLKWVQKDLGDIPVTKINPFNLIELKQKCLARGASEYRIRTIVYSLRAFLKFCKDILDLDVIEANKVKAPRAAKREVIYLNNEEIKRFIDSIKIENEWKGRKKQKNLFIDGLRFRTLVEVLLGTGARISEALSLDRDKIDFAKAEAKIIGKGNKERILFFNQRCLYWIRYYLEQRRDKEKALFVTRRLTRLHREDVSKLFKTYTKKSGIPKRVTPHILRHTMATNLLFNGCPINHVKEILGHERLETTCKYYLGVDKTVAKEAHRNFLNF